MRGHQLMPDSMRETASGQLPAASGKVARLAGGLSNGLSKLAAHALLECVLNTPAFATRAV